MSNYTMFIYLFICLFVYIVHYIIIYNEENMYKHGKNVSPCLDKDNRHANMGEGKLTRSQP